MELSSKFYPKRRGIVTRKIVVFLCLILMLSGLIMSPALASETASVSGTIFEDLNISQIKDLGENGLNGWTVSLLQGGKTLQTIKTNANGDYYFSDLPTGDYTIQVQEPNGWSAVVDDEQNFILNSGQIKTINYPVYQVIKEQIGYGPMIQISNVSIKEISATTAVITWFTNYSATSQVVASNINKSSEKLVRNDNGLGYDLTTITDFEIVTYHEITLTNLNPNETYYYRVISLPDPKQWPQAPRIFSQEYIFTTDSADIKAPENDNQTISNIEIVVPATNNHASSIHQQKSQTMQNASFRKT